MQNNYLNFIFKFLEKYKNKKTILLIDEYYLESPFNIDTECKDLKKYIQKNFTNEILIVYDLSQFYNVSGKYDLIINIHFSAKFSNQIDFINLILKMSQISTGFLNVLPFVGFVNYNSQNYNPIIFNQLNNNNNFSYNYFAFIDNFANRIEIETKFIDKFFFQTTQKKYQNNMDFVYKKIIAMMNDFSILSFSEIIKLAPLDYKLILPKRLPHHLSGHGMKTWVDKGAFNKILEKIDIKSFLDVGCGPGGMVNYVSKSSIDVLGIDGDESIIREQNHLFVIHDYCYGAYVPNKVYDLGWSVEFLEHVDKKFQNNYFETFKKCKYVFITHAPKNTKGYNHINLEEKDYWIDTFKKYNFEYEEDFTKEIRKASSIEKNFVKDFGLFFRNKNLNT